VTFTALLTGGAQLPWLVLAGCCAVAFAVLKGLKPAAAREASEAREPAGA
jgi:hypothetical protein